MAIKSGELSGRIPSLLDVRDYLDNDDPNKREQRIDQLLNGIAIQGQQPGEKEEAERRDHVEPADHLVVGGEGPAQQSPARTRGGTRVAGGGLVGVRQSG